MNTQSHQPLVPLAERPLAAPDYEDSQQQTIWHNPTDKTAILDLHYETPRATGRPPVGLEARTGKQRWTIKAGETKAIPSYFDMAIQHTQCFHVDCLQKPFVCRSTEEGHEKAIVGGFGPQLENRGTQKMPIKPGFITVAPALDDAQARANAAKQQLIDQLLAEHAAKAAQQQTLAEHDRATADIAARNANADASKNPNKK